MFKFIAILLLQIALINGRSINQTALDEGKLETHVETVENVEKPSDSDSEAILIDADTSNQDHEEFTSDDTQEKKEDFKELLTSLISSSDDSNNNNQNSQFSSNNPNLNNLNNGLNNLNGLNSLNGLNNLNNNQNTNIPRFGDKTKSTLQFWHDIFDDKKYLGSLSPLDNLLLNTLKEKFQLWTAVLTHPNNAVSTLIKKPVILLHRLGEKGAYFFNPANYFGTTAGGANGLTGLNGGNGGIGSIGIIGANGDFPFPYRQFQENGKAMKV